MRTNLVETVWHSFLKFRKKDSNIGGYWYCSARDAGLPLRLDSVSELDKEHG